MHGDSERDLPDFAKLIDARTTPDRVLSWTDAILEATPDGVIAIDHTGRVVEFNPAASRMFGWDREEILGELLGDRIVPEELREAHRQGMARFLETGEGPVIGKRIELEGLKRDGTRFPLELTITVIESAGGPTHFVAHVRDITARKAAGDARAESEWRLREMTDQLRAGLWLADWKNTRILHANPASLALAGRTPEELRENPLCWLEDVHSQDLPAVRDFINAAAPDEPRDLEFRFRNGDSYRWIRVRVSGTSDQDRVVGLAEDITERKNVDADVRRFRFMVEHVADAVFWVNREAQIQYANRSAAQSLQLELPDLLGKQVFDFDTSLNQTTWDALWTELEVRGHMVVESEHRRADGSTFPVEVSINHVTFAGSPFNCAVVRDISERHQSARKLELALDEARRTKNARDQFIANLSHEIRSPLTAILGFVDLIDQRLETDEEARTWVELVRRNGHHLDRMLTALLQMRNADSGQDEVAIERVSMDEMLALEIAIAHRNATDAGLEFVVIAPDALPTSFLADQTRLLQILDNLIDNAIKYTESGRVAVEITELEDAGDRSVVRFGVRDTGCGIDAGKLQHVFERFRRFNDDPNVRGVGLGLPIVRHLAHTMGGTVEIESAVGEGTFAYVDLPLEGVQDRSVINPFATAEGAPASSQSHPTLRGRVLLAEDARDLSLLYTRWLTDWGMEVVAVPDGRQALVEAAQSEFDLILLDWRMPSLDGLQVAHHARRVGVEAPMIGLSAHASADAEVEWLDAGANAYLTKPVDPSELHAMIQDLLEPEVEEEAEVLRFPTGDPRKQLRETFLEALREDRRNLETSLASGDREQAQWIAHRLKGSSASFGEDELGRLSGVVEQELSSDNPRALDQALNEWRKACRRVLESRSRL